MKELKLTTEQVQIVLESLSEKRPIVMFFKENT